MKAYVLDGIGELNFKEVTKPQIKENEVLVEVKANGICGSDIPRIFQTGTYNFPTIPGHEFSGIVVKSGAAYNDCLVGKRVGIFPLIPCMECVNCIRKNYEMCNNYDYLGSRSDGGFAKYVSVPVWNLIEIPDCVSYEEAAMLEPASVALHASRLADISDDSVVAVFGLGTIGLLIAQWARILGAKKVLLVGNHLEQRDISNELGFKFWYNTNDEGCIEWIRDQTNGEGVDIAIEAVGINETIRNAIDSVCAHGRVVLVGNPKGDINLNKDIYWKILRRQLTITGSWNSKYGENNSSDWEMVIDSIKDKEIKLEQLITHRFNFDELPIALDLIRYKHEYTNKVMVLMD